MSPDTKPQLQVRHDAEADVLEVNGVRYSGDIFRTLSLVGRPGWWFRVLRVDGGVVEIRNAREQDIKSGLETAGECQ